MAWDFTRGGPAGKTCGDCEFFGDFDKQILGPWEPIPGTDGKFYRQPFLGFDEAAGAVCAFPRSGTKCRVYLDCPACPSFKARTWTRPENCDNCDRCHGRTDRGGYLCSGWPFWMKEGREPCQNGHARYGENLKLF